MTTRISMALLNFLVPALLASTAEFTPGRLDTAVAALSDAAVEPPVLSRSTGLVRSATFAPGAVVADAPTVEEKAQRFLQLYGEAVGVEAPASDLAPPRITTDRLGHTRVAYVQQYRGVPVFGAQLHLHVDDSGEVVTISSTVIPAIDLDTVSPSVPAATAERRARSVVAKQHDLDPATLHIESGSLVVFNDGAIWGRHGDDHLVWEIVATDHALVRERLFIDAHTSRVVEQISEVEDITRRIYEYNGSNLVWDEGDPLPYSGSGPGRDEEINNLIEVAEQTYTTFLHLSGGDFVSWNGVDGSMRSFYDRTGMDCPNAYFDGSSTSFCVGTATDDVIAHEWTHGYTRSTHGLVYAWQSGALNEAYSDIFGETVDLLYDSGTDTPSTVRESATCSAATGNDEPELTVLEPASLAGGLEIRSATFNPAPPWSVTASVEEADDGTGLGNDACEPLVDFTPGRIAMVTMAGCQERFLTPVLNAQAAGAVGVIVVNPLNDSLVTMSGAGSVSIPAVFIGRTDGDALRAALGDGVVVSMQSNSDGSLRWLVSEDSGAFGGAIRDMWNPECLGDPGRVFSDYYYCGEGDNGGVHINSGVPNRAFALLVDGGTANGVEVPAIGLTRAAHIYWRAMSVYQSPLSDFRDHADMLAASCQDLIGAPLADLATGETSGAVVTRTHCDAIDAAMAATEMRQWPTQCGFATILGKNPPTVTGDLVVLSESFDAAPAGWNVSNQGVYDEYVPRDWVWTDAVPDGGNGGAFFAVNSPEIGNCIAGNDDQSGVMYLDSPALELPIAARPYLVFNHYIATEERVDGGNVKISVNGGPFVTVGSEAFVYSPYNDTLRPQPWNDNPLAGEEAFVGTDATTYRGSWGQSQIDLSSYAGGGDSIVVRFAFGSDGCGGQDGWYVDDVRLVMTARERQGGTRVVAAAP
jgi:Zn-dependent metalloprotease